MDNAQILIAVQRIEQFKEYQRLAKYICENQGPALIATATQSITLRELGRRTGLSSTYLSQIATQKITISTDAFLKIARSLNQ
jgi:hypothetical protein